MKREISRLITMLLALLIGIGVCVATASAEDPDEDGKYPLWIGETQVTTENKDNLPVKGGSAKYDPSTCTLTLSNVTGVEGETSGSAILYQGEGKDFLANGFQIKPPALTCDMFRFAARKERTVCFAAYESPSGARALVLANATGKPQRVTGEWQGRPLDITLPPHDLQLVK